MALTLKPIFADTTDCSEILFSDKTGNLSGGYTGVFAVANIHSSIITVETLCGDNFNEYSNEEAFAQDLADETETFTIEDYEDSNVLKGEYTVFFDPPGETSAVVTNGSNIIVIEGSEYNDYLDFNSVILDGVTYNVLTIVDNSTTLSVTLDTPYTGISAEGIEVIFGYTKVFYHAHVCTINKCLHSKIATLSTSNCKCKEKSICELSEKLFMFFGIDVWMEVLNYKKAQEIIDYLNLFCGNNKSDCGC